MTVAYCTLEDVKSSLSGDAPNMGSSHDQSLVSKILESSRNLDRIVAKCRGDSMDLFSFLADQLYSRQRVYLSSTPAPVSGTFLLSLDGQTTGPIDHDADGSILQGELENLLGSGNVTVDGFAGGPYTIDFAGTRIGPQPAFTGRASFDQADASITVLPMIQGVDSIPSERQFRPTPAAYGRTMMIDDAVEIVAVSVYSAGGSLYSVLTEAEFRRYPLRGLPVEGLKHVVGDWPEEPDYTIGVTARWGHALEIPEDVREGATIEAIRSHFSGLAGNDDRIGVTPFGKIMTSKAYTSKFHQLSQDYGYKLW